MDVRLLGPVTVVVDGAPVSVGRAAERAVLALLALQPGRVVSADRLIDDLWREDLPGDPGNALQVRVSKLRRALRAAGVPGDVVVTRPSGYLLAVGPDRVDAPRFARLVEEARRAADVDPRAAERRYLEAAGLWQGAPLAEFTADWALRERARLEELRLAMQEDLLRLRLDAGRHGEVLAELETLVAEHPLREGLRRQQMVALYRAGRQAEALEVYETTRRLLAEELGLDPSPELNAVRDAVLRQDVESPRAPRRPAPAPVPRLPARLTSVVGRADELARVVEMSATRRLITLTGPGGAGKTTLAMEAARAMAGRFPDGVVLVELAGVEDPCRVPAAVADALRLTGDGSGTDPTERLVAALAGHEGLLVLDNCEHVVDASAGLVERLLTGCPRLRVLATSREALAVHGEVQLPLHPLSVPAATASLEDLAGNDAVRLFRERAEATDPSFALDEATASPVADICRRLDGLPLAIELAAARTGTMPVAQVAARLSDRFALLTAGPRTAQARHRTLHATVDWSHDLLDRDEQVLFRRLAVFRGGWTLEQAESVCGAPPLRPSLVLDLLGRLVARSLVVPGRGEEGRFRMLETVRAYALERLEESGEAEAVARRHAQVFLAFTEEAAPMVRSGEQRVWMRRLLAERDNLDAALAWARAHAGEDPDVGLRMVGALGWWWFFGRHDEGRRWVDRMLEAGGAEGSPAALAAAQQAAALVWRPGACVVHPSRRCAAAAAESLAAAEAAGEELLAAYARLLLAVEAVAGHGVAESDDLIGEAESVLADAGDEWGIALAAFVRAEIGFRARTVPFAVAERLADRASDTFARLGDGWGRSAVLAHHGSALRMAGRAAEAVPIDEESIRIAGELGLLITLQWMQAELAYCVLLLGDTNRALQLCAAAEASARQLGAGEGSAFAALVRGVAARRGGDLAAARSLLAASAEELSAAGIGWLAAAALSQGGFVAELSGDLAAAEAAHRHALEIGLAGATPAVPGALEGLACVAVADGEPRWAARLLGTAAAVRAGTGLVADAFAREDIGRAAGAARRRLGPTAYAEAFEQGRRLQPATAAARPARTS